MDKPITRTFLRGTGGDRRFVEITWMGFQVEVVTGKVGAAGRASEQAFTSATERDAFITRRAQKALKDGYLEGNPGEVPVPDPPDPRAPRADALRKKYQGTAHLPEVVGDDDARAASKYGGTPFLPFGSTWPTCGLCAQPLQFVLQLARDEVPAEVRWAFREDLIQLFLCDTAGKAGDPAWLCQCDDRGRTPFSPTTLVRQVHRGAPPAEVRDALPESLLDLRRRCFLENLMAHCRTVGDEATAGLFAARIEGERVDPRDYEVPRLDAEATMHRPFLFPARRIKGFSTVTEVPAYGDLSLDDFDILEESLGLHCTGGDKLGGFPRWAQDRETLVCRSCRKEMRYLVQVVSNGLSPITVGGDGLGWVFVCAHCGEATFTWQR